MGKIKYSSRVANYLLAGISLDTKRFKQNTTSTTHDVAEKLLVRGADIDYVNNLFLEEFENYCRISNLIINGTIIKKYTDSLAPITVSFTLDRANPKTIYLKVKDNAGNVSGAASATFTYDTSAPEVTVSDIDYNRIILILFLLLDMSIIIIKCLQ